MVLWKAHTVVHQPFEGFIPDLFFQESNEAISSQIMDEQCKIPLFFYIQLHLSLPVSSYFVLVVAYVSLFIQNLKNWTR